MLETSLRPVQIEALIVPEVIEFNDYTRFRQAVASISLEAPQHTDAWFFSQPAVRSRDVTDALLVRSRVEKSAARFYYTDVPLPYDLVELDADTFNRLQIAFGPDIYRAKFISDNLRNGNPRLLPVGGACALETWGLELLAQSPVIKAQPWLERRVAEVLLDRAPYYSHVSGTMLQGGAAKIGVMYLEVFPWFLKIQSYGVDQAEDRTRETYSRIYSAVCRRAKLVDPGYSLLGVEFADLQLDRQELLRSWFDEYMKVLPDEVKHYVNFKYNPRGYLAEWVRYTYHGPEILNVIQDLALKMQTADLTTFDMHVRTKQTDHLRTNTNIFYPFGVDIKRYEQVCDLGIDCWQLQQRSAINGFLGFDDLMINGEVVHQTAKLNNGNKRFPQTEAELDQVLDSPMRLYAGNLDSHFACLDKTLTAASPEFQNARNLLKVQDRIAGMEKGLQEQAGLLRKLEVIGKILEQNETAWQIVMNAGETGLFTGSDKSNNSAQEVKTEIIRLLMKYVRTKSVQAWIKKNKFDIKLTQPESLFRDTTIVNEGDGSLRFDMKLGELLKQPSVKALLKEQMEIEIRSLKARLLLIESQIAGQRQDLARLISGVDMSSLLSDASKINGLPETPALPLYQNLVVSHAIQLSFDPDLREFVVDAAKISQSDLPETDKLRLLCEAMAQVLPKIKSYLRYIMLGGEYPVERATKDYKPVMN